MAKMIRLYCNEARQIERQFSDATMLRPDSFFDLEGTIDLCYMKSHIMKNWGHDNYSQLYLEKAEKMNDLFDGMLDRCEVFIN